MMPANGAEAPFLAPQLDRLGSGRGDAPHHCGSGFRRRDIEWHLGTWALVSVRRLHIGQLVISAVSFQVRWRPVTDIRFAFETLQHDHDAKTFGFAIKGPSH